MTSRFEAAVLQLMHTPKVGAKTLDRVLAAAQRDNVEVEDVLTGEPSEWGRYGLKGVTPESLKAGRERTNRLDGQLSEAGIRLLVKRLGDYPESLTVVLGDDAPPVLFALGSAGILRRKGVAFCGSRHASDKGLQIAHACAETLAREGVNVVSGYANGVDLTAHAAALAYGGTTTFVLAEGILRFKPKPQVRDLLDDGNGLVLSQFPPRSAWTVGNAMQRNAVVTGLSSVVLVVESGRDGGTFAAGEYALRRHRPVFVVEYSDPPPSAEGNRLLIDRGARPLRMKSDGTPNLSEVMRELEGPTPTSAIPSRPVRQPSLFDNADNE